MNRLATWLCITALALGHTGCATLSGLNAPRVSISNITPQEMTLFEQKLLVQVRIQNPNDVPLAVNGMTFDLELNGKPFANGLSNKQITIPRFGTEVMDVEVFSGLSGILRQFQHLAAGPHPAFTYRVRGKVYLDQPTSVVLPFDEQGELALPLPTETR